MKYRNEYHGHMEHGEKLNIYATVILEGEKS